MSMCEFHHNDEVNFVATVGSVDLYYIYIMSLGYESNFRQRLIYIAVKR
jgi:hypothetical protein